MSTAESTVVSAAQEPNLLSINAIIDSCVMQWDLPERVKRLSLSSYRYSACDLEHFEIVLAEVFGGEIAGVAAWQPAAASDLPGDKTGMLLHGLYVAPRYQHHGIGSLLVYAALDAVRTHGMDGLLVKAQTGAIGFFESREFIKLPIQNAERDYPHRWWRQI